MLEKFKNIHYMFHISIVFIIFPIAGVIVGDYPLFNLAMDPTICTCLLFGFSQSESHCAVDGLVDHACLHFLYIGLAEFGFHLVYLLFIQSPYL